MRSIWLRHELANFKKRLTALEKHVAATGSVLTEAWVVALEKKRDDDIACGEIETAHPSYLGSQDIFYVGTHERRRPHLSTDFCWYLQQSCLHQALHNEDTNHSGRPVERQSATVLRRAERPCVANFDGSVELSFAATWSSTIASFTWLRTTSNIPVRKRHHPKPTLSTSASTRRYCRIFTRLLSG